MNRKTPLLSSFWSFLAATALWLASVPSALADPPGKPTEGGGMSDYMLSYLVVILGIVLGMLVVAKPANRRDRERPAGYVEKNIADDKH